MFVWDSVSVLLQKTLGLVRDFSGIVRYREGGVAESRLFENGGMRWLIELLQQFLDE